MWISNTIRLDGRPELINREFQSGLVFRGGSSEVIWTF